MNNASLLPLVNLNSTKNLLKATWIVLIFTCLEGKRNFSVHNFSVYIQVNKIFAIWKVVEFWYEYSITINILKTIKRLVSHFCYGLAIILHRMTGLNYNFHVKLIGNIMMHNISKCWKISCFYFSSFYCLKFTKKFPHKMFHINMFCQRILKTLCSSLFFILEGLCWFNGLTILNSYI